MLRPGDQCLDHRDVPVVDMGVGDDMDELADSQAADLRHQVDKHGVLRDVPGIGDEHVLRALVEDGAEPVVDDIERHAVGARVEVHLMQVGVVVDVGHDAPALGIVAQVKQHTVHLVEEALAVDVLDAELVAVGLADRAVGASPAVPDAAAQVGDAV
ncbi:hypothetical protein SDC9_193332 [bioreactor metagenome]|uniref:Uncharacterized protein n=1 Tax=bioreactor metagenome TaxID=1076179 RepID=A0A645I3A3_9ZZZZ